MHRSQTPQKTVEVRLYSHLRARFGKSYHMAVNSAAEAVRALCIVLPGFRQHLAEHSAPGYRVWLGDAPIESTEELCYPPGKQIRIVPVTAGAKDGGLGKILLGAALIGGAFFGLPTEALFTFGTTEFSIASIAMSIGTSMVLGGVSQLLAGSPSAPTPAEKPQNLPSYAFNGAVNTTAQGNPVPILYGRLRVGSQVISTGLSTTQIADPDPVAPPPAVTDPVPDTLTPLDPPADPGSD